VFSVAKKILALFVFETEPESATEDTEITEKAASTFRVPH
jgi:hypothetical protein